MNGHRSSEFLCSVQVDPTVKPTTIPMRLDPMDPDTKSPIGRCQSVRPRSVVIWLLFLVAVLAIPVFALHEGPSVVFNFLSADSFYYLTIAKNSHSILSPSFDGERPTNGFHPLWQIVLIGLFRLTGPSQELQISIVFLVSTCLVTAGLILAGHALQCVTGSSLSILWLVPGLFQVLFGGRGERGLTYTYSCWAFMNGMESPLSLFFGGLLLHCLARRRTSRLGEDPPRDGLRLWPFSSSFAWGLGLIVMCCVMSRLDDVFVAAGFVLCLLAGPNSSKVRALQVGLPTALFLAIYIGHHFVSGQTLLPTSAAVKSSNALEANLRCLVSELIPLAQWTHCPVRHLDRLTGLTIPMVVCALLLSVGCARLGTSPTPCLPPCTMNPLLVYVLGKGFYNWFFVEVGHQGYWYYALPVLVTNWLLVALACAGWRALAAKTADKKSHATSALVRSAGTVSLALWTLVYLITVADTVKRLKSWNSWYGVWSARVTMARDLERSIGQSKLISNDDGLLAYALPYPSASILGFVTDQAGYAARRRGLKAYWDYCIERGFTVVGSTDGGYFDLSKWYVTRTVYQHQQSHTVFVRLEKSR